MKPLCDQIKEDLDGIKFPCSTGALAKPLGVCRQTILEWIKARHLEAIRTPSGVYRIPRDSAEKLIRHLRHGN